MKNTKDKPTHRVVFKREGGCITFTDVPADFVSGTVEGFPMATVERIPKDGIEGNRQCYEPLLMEVAP